MRSWSDIRTTRTNASTSYAPGGTSLSGGRFTLAGSVLGALIIQTLTSTIYSAGVPPEVTLVAERYGAEATLRLRVAESSLASLRAALGELRLAATEAATSGG